MRRWFDAARMRLHLIVAGRAVETRMNDEIAFHIDMEAERLVRDHGVDPAEARRLALATFGGVAQHKEELRAGRGLAWLGTLSLDARLALRMLRKTPGLTAIAVLGLSVAVAIGCVCFSAVYRIIDAKLPVPQGERVIGIRNIDRRAASDARATHLHYFPLWRLAMRDVAELGVYRHLSRNIVTGASWSESARVAVMTASGFRIVGVAPLSGRYLLDADERPDAPAVVVIGYTLWQQRYAGRQDIIGQSLQIGDTRHTIVGVMPEGFAFPVNNRVWIPLRLNAADYEDFRAPSVDVFGRLANGATIEDVRRQAELVARRLAASDSATHAALHQRVIPYTRTFIDNGDAVWTYHLIQLLVTLLLVVIGTNVAVLVYARTAGRMGEIAVRSALGASRGRIVGQLFAEAFALSLVAAVVGIGTAWLAMREIDAGLQRLAGEQLPYWLRIELTPSVVLYAIALAAVGAVIIGVIPALKITGGRVRSSLQQLSAGGSSLRLGRSWMAMIVAQVAIAVAILPLAIAGIGAWKRAETAQIKIATKQILTAAVSHDPPMIARIDSAEARLRNVTLRASLITRLLDNPRIAEVVVASNAPGEETDLRYEPDTANLAKAIVPDVVAGETQVEPDYFRVIGIPLLAGRTFDNRDLVPDANTVIVNRSFINRMFDGKVALGSRIRVVRRRGEWTDTTKVPAWQTIVGIISDFPVDSGGSAARIYRAMPRDVAGPVVIAMKMNGSAATEFIPSLRAAAIATSPELRLDAIRTLDQAVADAQSGTRLMVVVLELVGLSTVLLSAAGIYALMSFTITRRRREIGIRSALGAAPGRLLAGEMSRVLAQIAVGIIIGIVIAGGIDNMLEGGWTGRRGLLGLINVMALMLAIGIISALKPAIGALRIQPTEALRSE